MSKAIFFDIDGTLIDVTKGVTHISCRVRESLRKLQKAGHKIFLASGRPYAFLDAELLDFGFDGYVLNNGAVVAVDGEVIFQEELDRATVENICEMCERENVEYILESHPYVYLRPEFKIFEDFYTSIDISLDLFVREFNISDVSTLKMEFITRRQDSDEVDGIYTKILKTPGFDGWCDPFHYKNLELYSAKNSKGSGIVKALEFLKIDLKDSYAFGDGRNDIEMLQTVGTGLAMGNAADEVKKFADYVVPSVHEDGVAVGTEKYIL